MTTNPNVPPAPGADVDRNGPPSVPMLTWGWVLRRSALWAGLVIVGVASACALYGFASVAGSETDAIEIAEPAESPPGR